MPPEKPVVFFSHSSRDKVALKKLKERFDELTGGTIDVFLSSDGQSIRLGSNWVSTIETALSKAKIMFVFVSPNSLGTPWLYFETGHAYGREPRIDVVPVGLFGVDIGKLSPPVNLLQGFNLTDAESMNNIIAKVNEVFGTKHKLGFEKNDYGTLQAEATGLGEKVLGSHVAAVESMSISVRASDAAMDRIKRLLLAIDNCFERPRANTIPRSLTLVLPGATARIEQLFKRAEGGGKLATEPSGESQISVSLDPTAVDLTLPGVEAAIAQAFAEEPRESPASYWCGLQFKTLVEHITSSHKQMGRLRDFSLAPQYPGNSNVQFKQDDMTFQVDWRDGSHSDTTISIARPTLAPYSQSRLGDLIALLFDRGILIYKD